MKSVWFFLLGISLMMSLMPVSTAYADTPVCRCVLIGSAIECEGGFHDGSSAVAVTMWVIAYSGETLTSGKLDRRSRFTTPMPDKPFYILMDVAPGEMFELDWRDIEGVDKSLFPADDVAGAGNDP